MDINILDRFIPKGGFANNITQLILLCLLSTGAFQIVEVDKQGIRKCPSVLLQLKSATQGTMIVAMQLGSKNGWGNLKCTRTYHGPYLFVNTETESAFSFSV